MLLKKKHDVTISLSGKLPTYPSPNSTTVNWHHVKVNVGLGEGYVGSCPDTDIVTSRFFFSNIKNVEFFYGLCPFAIRAVHKWEVAFNYNTQIVREYLKQNWSSLILVEFSWRSIVFPKLTDVTYHHIPLAAKKTGFYRLLWNNKTMHVSLLMQIHL